MQLERSAMAKEIALIIKEGVVCKAYDYQAFVYVRAENTTYKAPKVVSIDIDRRYLTNYTDKTIIKMLFTGGIYANHIFKYRDGLDVTIVRKPVFLSSGGNDYRNDIQIETFTAVLTNQVDPTVNQTKQSMDDSILDLTTMTEVEFELETKTAEELRMISVGGIFRNCTTEEAMRALLTNEACQAQGDANIVIKGVDIVPTNNLEVREHIILEQGVKLTDLPNYLQNKCGGVYPTGIGYYLQNRYWYIYPAFDYTRVNSTTRTITFLNIPKNRLNMIEKTYRMNGDQIIALVTGSTSAMDLVDLRKRNEGNGVSFTNASSIMGDMTQIGGNKAIFDRGASNTEVTTSERTDGKNYIPVSKRPITNNSMREFSRMAEMNAASMILVWENSEPDLIIPGMMATVFYLDGDETKSLVGVISEALHYTYMYNKGMAENRYVNSSAITIRYDVNNLN